MRTNTILIILKPVNLAIKINWLILSDTFIDFWSSVPEQAPAHAKVGICVKVGFPIDNFFLVASVTNEEP